MFTIHLVAFTAETATGTQIGVGRVGTDYDTPTREEREESIPGFITGTDLGREPTYTLRYENSDGPVEKQVGSAGVERVGGVLMRCADRGTVWNIECFDELGEEVTFNFAVFCA
ncbi:hypothetical protein OG292_19430 [Streptomyces sp. NBC_01511]|uniref:hypothetical protein n=1 Tax=Streptomyces sp. NBC_01511 TaxID=2903889 RepID=UPI0038694215